MNTERLIRERAVPIVSSVVDSYLLFKTEGEREEFYRVAVDLLVRISNRIESNESISISEFKGEILALVFYFGHDTKTLLKLFELVWVGIDKEVKKNNVENPDAVKTFERYGNLIFESLREVALLAQDDVTGLLGRLEEYGESTLQVNLGRTDSRLLVKNRDKEKFSLIYPKRLKTSFQSVFEEKVLTQRQRVFSAAFDINSVISDSYVKIPSPEEINLDLLTATFAGEGKKIYDSSIDILSKATDIAGYQGSHAGSLDYQAVFYEYLLAMSYGKVLSMGSLNENFGDFESIYGEKSRKGGIFGLKFLEPIYKTRSGNQSESLSQPVSSKFLGGIRERFGAPEGFGVSFGALVLESIYEQCLKLGDSINSILNRPPSGIGDVSYIYGILQEIFPPSMSMRGRREGLTGSIYNLLSSYKKLYSLTMEEPDLGLFFQQIATLSQSVQTLSSSLKSAGFDKNGIVASLELKIHTPSKEKASKRLIQLGFTKDEVDGIMASQNFSDLLSKFSPITTSADIISFFRAFELAKLIYEFGGQESIDQYINFLYGVDESTSLLRLLSFLERGRSTASRVVGSKYAKLIGYLVTLTYAINPSELIRVNSILSKNNLNLFDSITYLIQRGEPSVIKNKDQISLLSGVAAQMVVSDNSDYEFGRPLWNELISKSSGNAIEDLTGLYDKVEGIIPEELNSILNHPSPTSPLGQLMDGVRGGSLTTVLRQCNLLGILYSLSDYRNSGQLINKRAEEFEPILRTVSTMDILSERLDLAYLIFRKNSEEKPQVATYNDPLITAQNKSFEAIIALITGQTVVDPIPVDPPGIGNSRLPNGVRMTNSLTPEEASIIAPLGQSLGVFSRTVGESTTGSGLIRMSVENLLASGVVTGGVTSGIELPEQTSNVVPLSEYSVKYEVSPSASPLITSGSPFSPTSSCKKFGGTNCEYDEDRLCKTKNGYNKSSLPEEGYGQSLSPGVDNPSVMVDRPLGQTLSPSTTNNSVPSSSPEYYFTQYGLNKSSRQGLLKTTEMLCASLSDPFEYGACMSLLKCKKFRPPYLGKYSLPFCPTTLQGGRIIR